MGKEKDIVARLRAEANALGEEWPDQAADEIERLRATLATIANGRNTSSLAPSLAEAEIRRSLGQERGIIPSEIMQLHDETMKMLKE